jgi:hypothetical protein
MDVGSHKRAWIFDRPVHMRFSGEVNNNLHPFVDQFSYSTGIRNEESERGRRGSPNFRRKSIYRY